MATAQTHTLLEAALAYAAKGWHVFPCHTPTSTGCSCLKREACTDIGKHPRTKNGLSDATTAEAQIRKWWKMWPAANVAIRTGQVSGLVVLDRDDYKGGADSLEELERTYSPLPETVLGLTGGGGQHYVFAHPGSHVKNGVEDFAPGLDIRGDGGYIIAPPSLHESGKQYTWEVLHEPEDTPLAPMPDWLLALCQEPARPEHRDAGAFIPNHQRNNTLFRMGSSMRARGFTETVILAALREMNATQCEPPVLTEAELRKIVGSIAKYEAGPSREDLHQQRNGDTPGSEPAWKDTLLGNKSGTPQQTIGNFIVALQNLDPWKSTGLWYDSVREQHMLGSLPVHDEEATEAGLRVEQATGIRVIHLRLMGHALDYVARQTTRDLLQEWVATLPDVSVSNLLTIWLRTYAHVPDTVSDAYVADVSRIIPVAMIARILRPGCQYRCVPILEGPENAGKSKLTKALAGADPYGRSWHVALSAGMEGKEAHMMLDGALIAELEELSSYTKTDENRMKALITMEADSFVPKFANKRVDHPRRTCFLATVNPEGDGAYLKGQSGNTRFLPIRVADINITGFLAKRTQLFAEAKAYYLAHRDTWWQLECEEDAKGEREERRQAGVYEGQPLQVWLSQRQQCTWQDVAEQHLQIPKDRWNKALQMEIGKALRASHWIPARENARRYWIHE